MRDNIYWWGSIELFYQALKFIYEVTMRYMTIITTVTIALVMSACQNADLERQKNLIDQTSRTYAITEDKATKENPKKYEFCGNEQHSCPVLTKTTTDKQENQAHENAQ